MRYIQLDGVISREWGMARSLPNILTLFRLSLIPIFVVVFFLPYSWRFLACAAIFSLAGFTDWLDGYLARKLAQESALGRFLDPVADKLTVAVALVLLVQCYAQMPIAVAATVIIAREIVISALREWMALIGQRAKVAVSKLGKLKTLMQMVSIVLLLVVAPNTQHWLYPVGLLCLFLATALTFVSMLQYLQGAYRHLFWHTSA